MVDCQPFEEIFEYKMRLKVNSGFLPKEWEKSN